MRVHVTLACETCKERSYISNKNKTKTPDRLAKKKYCPRCDKHTLHKETK